MENERNLLESINKAFQENYIHYDPTRKDYTINDFELKKLEEINNNIWKEIFFVCIGFLIPSLTNLILIINKISDKNIFWGLESSINIVIVICSLIIGIFCFIFWKKDNAEKCKTINDIKSKPIYKI